MKRLLTTLALAAGCAWETEYETPVLFCTKALECWHSADGDLQKEAECKWDWPMDWQWAEAVVLACDDDATTCEEMLAQCGGEIL